MDSNAQEESEVFIVQLPLLERPQLGSSKVWGWYCSGSLMDAYNSWKEKGSKNEESAECLKWN